MKLAIKLCIGIPFYEYNIVLLQFQSLKIIFKLYSKRENYIPHLCRSYIKVGLFVRNSWIIIMFQTAQTSIQLYNWQNVEFDFGMYATVFFFMHTSFVYVWLLYRDESSSYQIFLYYWRHIVVINHIILYI